MVVGDVATAVEIIVLGAGPAGCSAALRAAQLGRDVVLVDPKPLGGYYLHESGLPTKLLLTAARRAWQIHHSKPIGLNVESYSLDFAAMQRWKAEMIAARRQTLEQQLDRHGVAVAQGKGWFINDAEMRVEGEYGALKFIFEQAVIATGVQPAPLDALPFDGEHILAPAQALNLNPLPPSIAIIGADYIAAELATLFTKLDVPTHLIIPAGHRLLAEFDPAAGQLIEAQLKQQGVEITFNATNLQAFIPKADKLVVSAGIEPDTAGLQLESAGVATDERGFIPVNDRMQTNRPHIYAAGDVTGGPPLAALAHKQGRIAAEAIAGRPVQYAPQAIPRVAWTDPEVASVGLTAAQAQALGYQIIAAQRSIDAGSNPLMFDSPDGLALIVAEQESQLLLGVTLVCPHAGELIGEAALAIEMGATLTDLAETIHPYSRLSHILPQAAEAYLE
ncbi:MAG: NAD(P)/FAD-dependent oxidoreductase [Anaerolineaceae bacterium]|nr:NAD(P)/FAD-dependent oxidoreductase [Anaerolineaceae bacterium]MCB9101329.1 NAD(P)/FAD-dependent oxidoreductase [Anaerolineales bacterium]